MEVKRDDYVYDNLIQVEDEATIASRRFLAGVFTWMFVALGISAFCAYEFATNQSLFSLLFDADGGRTGLGTIMIFAPFAFILIMSFGINKISYPVLAVLFVAFSVCIGASLSIILLIYTSGSILGVFATASLIFAGMALAGYTTKQDLTSFGSLLMMGLFGVIIASVINYWFLHSQQMDYIISYIGVAVFVGLTAYDVQRLKRIGAGTEYGEASLQKMALMGALTLYLDFVNLFLRLLRIFGRRR